jgi:hypothetical protein
MPPTQLPLEQAKPLAQGLPLGALWQIPRLAPLLMMQL